MAPRSVLLGHGQRTSIPEAQEQSVSRWWVHCQYGGNQSTDIKGLFVCCFVYSFMNI